MADARVIAVDWSGALLPAAQKKAIWLAEVVRGELARVECGRTRDELLEHLIELAADDSNLVVGFDFAFSLPARYLHERGVASARQLWQLLAEEALTPKMEDLGLAAWLNDPDTPFWSSAPAAITGERAFRRTEQEVKAQGAPAKAVFQLVGAGQVGRGSLYGMQALHRLKRARFSVWPFDPARLPLVIEIYPRLLRTFLPPESLPAAAHANEHARDAAVSALAMAASIEEILALAQEPPFALEGRIWQPGLPRPGVVVLRQGAETARQGFDYVVGVSQKVCGSTGLSLSYVVLPPGAVSEPHAHEGYETAIYQLEGRAETSFGAGLAERVVTEAGDFLFIPPGIPHRTRNLSDTEPVRAIVARNDAADEERIVAYGPESDSSRKRAPGTGFS